MIPRPAAAGRIRHQTHLSPRHSGLFCAFNLARTGSLGYGQARIFHGIVDGTKPALCHTSPPIKAWVTLEERAEIEIRAAQTGLWVSAYIRTAGLNHPVRSVLDLKEIGRAHV